MASGIGRVIDGFRLDEFALRAFENMLLRAVGVHLSALQLHSGSTHGAARGLDRLERRCRGLVGHRHGFQIQMRILARGSR